MIYAILLVSLVLPFYACFARSSSGRMDPFQPGIAVFCLYVIFINVPAIYILTSREGISSWVRYKQDHETAFIYALGLCVVALGAFGFGYRMPWFGSIGRFPVTKRAPLQLRMDRLPVLLLLGALGAAALISRGSDSSSTLGATRLLGGGGQATGEVSSFDSILAILCQFLQWSSLALFIALFRTKYKLLCWIVIGLTFALLFVTSGKRTDVVPLLLFPVIVSHYTAKPLTRKTIITFGVGAVVFSAALLMTRVLVPQLIEGGKRSRMAQEIILSDPGSYLLSTPEYSAFDMVIVAMENRDDILADTGGIEASFVMQNIEPLFAPIPRFIWEGKPEYQDMSQYFFKYSSAGSIGVDVPTVGFAGTGIGVFFVFGGTFGVVAASMLTGAFSRYVYERFCLTTTAHAAMAYGAFVWYLFHTCRYGGLGFTGLDFFYKSALGMMLFWYCTYSPRMPRIVRRPAEHSDKGLRPARLV